MGITAKQREDRRNYLGSSDVAALFGLNPYMNAFDVWLEKTGQLEPEQQTRPWLETGNEFESVILDRAARVLGPLRKNQKRSARDRGLPLASHIDAIVVESGRPVEAKTSGLWWPMPEEWGEPGTDEVPDRVVIQAQVHLIVTDQDLCHAPCMKYGLRQDLYEIPRNDAMVRTITEYCGQWWERHVIEGVEPEGMPSLEIVRRRKREPGSTADIPDELIERWRRFVTAEGRCRKLKEAALTEVLHAMGDAEVGVSSLGTVEFVERQRQQKVMPAKVTRSVQFKKHKPSSN